MTVDWLAIRNDYINGGGSYRKLAKKYGVSQSRLNETAKQEHWFEDKKKQDQEIRAKADQKTAEKISDAMSEEAAAKARIRVKLMKMAENWVDQQNEQVQEPSDFRRIVQCCADMGVFETNGSNEDGQKNNLLEIIRETGEISTDDIPEVE